jgi:hypothetical protein
MILERARVLTLLATGGALGFAPADTAAQSTPTDSLRIPASMISFGAGGARDMGDWQDGGAVQVASAQFLVGRHLAVEGEVTRWKTQTRNLRPIFEPGSFCTPGRVTGCPILAGFEHVSETDEGWSSGANLVFRSEPHRRVSGFVGGGAFVGRRLQRFVRSPSLALGGQALGGADVRVAGPLRAYADLRFTALSGQVRLAATGGVRVVAHTRPAVTDVKVLDTSVQYFARKEVSREQLAVEVAEMKRIVADLNTPLDVTERLSEQIARLSVHLEGYVPNGIRNRWRAASAVRRASRRPLVDEARAKRGVRPQRDSNPCFGLERATSWASGRWGPKVSARPPGVKSGGRRTHQC